MGCFSFRKRHEAVPEEAESQASVSSSVLERICISVIISRQLAESRKPVDQPCLLSDIGFRSEALSIRQIKFNSWRVPAANRREQTMPRCAFSSFLRRILDWDGDFGRICLEQR